MIEEKPVELEKLPIHAIRAALKEKNIQFKTTDKKKDLIRMLRAGETAHKPKVVAPAPKLSDQKSEKALPVVPKEIRAQLEEMAKTGLKWEINEEECTITFMRDIPACANLDQPAMNILMTAREAYAKQKPKVLGTFD